ncbi:hypothetical protein DXG01_010138 [Tephrocybe rancida]|nr:hypothetical protein DXG01_010138 [Tephrocybe rancida]
MTKPTSKSSKRRHDALLSKESSPSPSKRRKTASAKDPSPSTPSTNDLVHDLKYYFDDGDIDVLAGTVLFRVHINKLKTLGGIFSTIFDMPRPPTDAGEVPQLPLPDTDSSDVRYLMAYVYGDVLLRQMTDDKLCGKVPWNATKALLKLSDKYDFVSLRHEVIETLKFLLPCGPTYTPASSVITGIPKSEQTLLMRVLPFEAINLCRRYELSALLPMAFYHAAQLPIADLLVGVPSNGTIACLPMDDIITILVGRDRLKLANRNVRLRYFNEFEVDDWSDKCRGRNNQWDLCTNYLARTQQEFNRDGFMDSRTDVLDLMTRASRKISSHLCLNCADDLKQSLEDGVAAIWERLPGYFDLGRWETVVEAQRVVDERYRD